MTQNQVLLVWPPAASVHGPPLGLAAVAGHLRTHRPDARIRVDDLNVRAARHVLDRVPRESDLHRVLRSRWTQADVIQDALARWSFGSLSPAGIGALPDWESHYLSQLFSQVLDDFVASEMAAPDLVGLSVCDNGLIAAIGLTRRLRERFPDAQIVWGGVSMSELQAQATLRAVPEVDAIVSGEGEAAIVALYDALPGLASATDGILTREQKRVPCPPRENYLVSEPAFDLFDLSAYPALELPMSIGRGCAWGRCHFCNENYATSEFQPIDPERTARWALEWQQRFRPVSFDLVDSAANSNRKGFRRFVDALVEGGGLREWRCMMRTAGLRESDLQRARESGLRTVYFGIESFSDEVLTSMNKGETVAQHLRAIRMAIEAGIQIEGDLIFFYPTDTPEAVRTSIALMKRYDHLLGRVDLSFSRFVPGLQSETWKSPGNWGIRLLPHSLRLSRHLPADLAGAFEFWDPMWEFERNDRERTVALATAYLELQSVVERLRRQPLVTRTWYESGSLVVLETSGHDGDALDRVFLEGRQRDLWRQLAKPRSTERLAAAVDASIEEVDQFISALAERGFLSGGRSGWSRTAFVSGPGHSLSNALRNCASRPGTPDQDSASTSTLARDRVD